jgi:hypothetical protein
MLQIKKRCESASSSYAAITIVEYALCVPLCLLTPFLGSARWTWDVRIEHKCRTIAMMNTMQLLRGSNFVAATRRPSPGRLMNSDYPEQATVREYIGQGGESEKTQELRRVWDHQAEISPSNGPALGANEGLTQL